MSHISTMLNAITRIDIRDMSNASNNYDPHLVHPMRHSIEIVDELGDVHSIAVGELAIALRLLARYDNNGSAFDILAGAAPNQTA